MGNMSIEQRDAIIERISRYERNSDEALRDGGEQAEALFDYWNGRKWAFIAGMVVAGLFESEQEFIRWWIDR